MRREVKWRSCDLCSGDGDGSRVGFVVKRVVVVVVMATSQPQPVPLLSGVHVMIPIIFPTR